MKLEKEFVEIKLGLGNYYTSGQDLFEFEEEKQTQNSKRSCTSR